jgi:phage terminase large subunit-like protein
LADFKDLSSDERLALIMKLPPEQRRKALALVKEDEEYKHINQWESYKPYKKQLEFHNCISRERLFSAGNQLGKTYAGGMEVAYHATGRYPKWWKGRRFPRKRPLKIWVAGDSGESTRDNPQRILCGNIGDFGAGTIPKQYLGKVSKARGVPDLIDNLHVKHISGKQSQIFFKSYGKGRERWQGETIDILWCDEEPPYDVYSEGLTRTNKNLGPVVVTFTPLKGMSEVVYRFYDEANKSSDRDVIQMTIWDVVEEGGHYDKKQAQQIIDAYPEHEREARSEGKPMLGSGRIFPITEQSIKIGEDHQIPRYWPQLMAMDFGWGDHPTACIKGAWNREADRLVLCEEYRRRESTDIVSIHASAIRAMGGTEIPIAWPHDGKMGNKLDGTEVSQMYRDQGLYMLEEHATFEQGGFGVEPSIQRCFERMKTGRLMIMSHLSMLFDEIRMYHRKDGKVVPLRDDLISAMRYLEMMLRYSEVVSNRFEQGQETINVDNDRSAVCGY